MPAAGVLTMLETIAVKTTVRDGRSQNAGYGMAALVPKAEQKIEEWQTAMQALLLVVEQNGPTMFARIGVMSALHRNVERVLNPDRKDTH
jgi:hypothetical protein